MAKAKAVHDQQGRIIGHAVRCPVCGCLHTFDDRVNSERARLRDGGWEFNGDLESPTFSPSMLMRTNYDIAAFNRAEKEGRTFPVNMPRVEYVCHSYVRNGRIEFLNDCTHSLKGQTVDLPEID